MEEWNRRRFISAAALAAGSGLAGWNVFSSRGLLAQAPPPGIPDEILNPVEVSGAEAVPVIGKLPGQKRMYVLPDNAGEYHRVGSQVMKRIARREDTGDVHELATFTGNTGATMPRHAYLSSHAAVLVMRGEIELELGGDRWTMMRGDFANLPPGTRARLDDEVRRRPAGAVLDEPPGRVGVHGDGRAAGRRAGSRERCRTRSRRPRWRERLRRAISSWRRQRRRRARPSGSRTSSCRSTPGAYVLADGGGERFGGNTFLARNANTTGQFLFIITEGGPGGGVGAHFHARHFENFFGARRRNARLGVRQGRAAAHRRLFPGAAAQSARLPPEPGLQPVRGIPDAGHLRELLHQGRGRAGAWRCRRPRWPGARGPWRCRGSRPRRVRRRRGRDVPVAADERARPRRLSARRARGEAAAAAAGSDLDEGGRVAASPIVRRCSRTRRRSAACRSAGRSRRNCGARWRSSRGRRISFESARRG